MLDKMTDKVVDTAKDVVEEVVQLTVKIAGEVYTFVLKSVNTIAKGISWVLQQLGAAWEKVIDFLGFIFNWGDILTVTDNVLTMLNAGLDYGQLKIASLEDKAKAWIGGAKIHLKTALADVRKNQKTELGQASTSGLLSQDSGDSAAKDSVAFNWIGYQIQHGAVLTNAKLTPPSDVAGTMSIIVTNGLGLTD
jgi:hypothetical protein